MGEQKKTEPLIFQRDSANKIFFIFFLAIPKEFSKRL